MGVVMSYELARSSLVDLALSKVEQEAELTAKDLRTYLEQFSGDLLMLSSAPPLQGMLRAQDNAGRDPATGRSYDEWVDWLQQIFATTARSKRFYQQIRYLNEHGDEVVRIEYRDRAIAMVWDKEAMVPRMRLEHRGDAVYFTGAQGLRPGQMAVSPLMLSDDAEPVPIIYLSTPVYDRAGAFRGIVVSTVYAASFLERLSVRRGQIYLADQAGIYLAHPDPSHTFSAHRRAGYSADADFSRAYAAMRDPNRGRLHGARIRARRGGDAAKAPLRSLAPRTLLASDPHAAGRCRAWPGA